MSQRRKSPAGDPHNLHNAAWTPPAHEQPLYASFWQHYEDRQTCVIYDSQGSGEAWIEVDCLWSTFRQDWR